MSVLSRLHAASFKGASFLFVSGSRMGGRKNVLYEFPNKRSRLVEDIGGLLPSYNITGEIQGSGRDYFSKRNLLITAFESEDSGILLHPYYGKVKCFCQTYDFSEAPNETGVTQFNATFQETKNPIFPTVSKNNKSLIASLSDSFSSSIESAFGFTWNVSNSSFGNFDDAAELLTDASNFFDDQTQTFVNASDEVSEFFGQLSSFTDNIFTYINRPALLGTTVTTLFGSLDNLGSSAIDRLRISRKFFSFASGYQNISELTTGKKQRKKNRQTMQIIIDAMALSNAYLNVPQIDFSTEDDITDVQNELEDQFDKIITENAASDVDIVVFTSSEIFPQSTIEILKSMRDQVRIYLEEAKVNAKRVTTIDAKEASLTTIVYSYYGSLDDLDVIQDLNQFAAPSHIKGNMEIVTE